MKASGRRPVGRLQQPLDVLEEDADCLVVLRDLAGQILIGHQHPEEPDKGTHDRHIRALHPELNSTKCRLRFCSHDQAQDSPR